LLACLLTYLSFLVGIFHWRLRFWQQLPACRKGWLREGPTGVVGNTHGGGQAHNDRWERVRRQRWGLYIAENPSVVNALPHTLLHTQPCRTQGEVRRVVVPPAPLGRSNRQRVLARRYCRSTLPRQNFGKQHLAPSRRSPPCPARHDIIIIMEYENESRAYDGTFGPARGPPRVRADWAADEPRGYERDRSRSPRGERRDDTARARSASPNTRDSRYVSACLPWRAALLTSPVARRPSAATRTTRAATRALTSSSRASIRRSTRRRSRVCLRSMARWSSATSCATRTPRIHVASASSRWSHPTRPMPPRRDCKAKSTRAGH